MLMDPYLKHIERFNEQLTRHGLRTGNLDVLRRRASDTVILVGMGGSALPGEIVNAAAAELGLRHTVIIWKDYGLPRVSHHHRSPLYIFTSFSGNTEETLSGLSEFLKMPGTKHGARTAVIATGGALLRIAQKNGLPYITFPAGDLTPRQASGKMFYAISELLFAARLIARRPREFTHLSPAKWKRPGRALARRLNRKLIHIYTQTADWYLGYFWKIKFNESAKVPAFNNVVPEMNHNELVGFTRSPFSAAALFLKNPDAHARVAKRYRVNERLIRAQRADVITLPITGKTRLERTWNTIMYADWTTYALAKLRNVDPKETDIIDGPRGLKAAMRR
jgi:glucose/mannose-6-phosphate isomerase